jgi:hypothetical protein
MATLPAAVPGRVGIATVPIIVAMAMDLGIASGFCRSPGADRHRHYYRGGKVAKHMAGTKGGATFWRRRVNPTHKTKEPGDEGTDGATDGAGPRIIRVARICDAGTSMAIKRFLQ